MATEHCPKLSGIYDDCVQKIQSDISFNIKSINIKQMQRPDDGGQSVEHFKFYILDSLTNNLRVEEYLTNRKSITLLDDGVLPERQVSSECNNEKLVITTLAIVSHERIAKLVTTVETETLQEIKLTTVGYFKSQGVVRGSIYCHRQ